MGTSVIWGLSGVPHTELNLSLLLFSGGKHGHSLLAHLAALTGKEL